MAHSIVDVLKLENRTESLLYIVKNDHKIFFVLHEYLEVSK